MGKNNFNIPDPRNKLSQAITHLSKYNIGESGVNFYDIRSLKPTFAFDYLSLNKTNLCFDCPSKTKDDLLGFIQGLKKVSGFTYDELSRTKALRFHKIDFNDKRVHLKPKTFLNILAPSGRGLTENELPTLYQFDLQYVFEARVAGFLFKGVFYVVWFDRHHVIYPKKN